MSEPTRHQPTRLIQPLGMRVLVRLLPADARTASGLYVPATTVKDESREAIYGEVIEVARAEPSKEQELSGANVSGIPDGSRVLFLPETGVRVPWDDTLRLVDTKHVLAVVEEVAPEAAH